MDAHQHDCRVSAVAAAIAVPARTRMLCSLMDGHARTSTELAIIAEVSPSTASEHLNQLRSMELVRLHVQGRHRYYSLCDESIAQALESLMVVGHHRPGPSFTPTTPDRLQLARTCYDHMAGTVAVHIHDRFISLEWLEPATPGSRDYRITSCGEVGLRQLGIDFDKIVSSRRRIAFACMDWSMRRPHLGGALGAALLNYVLTNGWATQDLDSRALCLTPHGRREMFRYLDIDLNAHQ